MKTDRLHDEKRLVAAKSLEYVRDGMKLGLGTGSTADIAIDLLGERVRQGLDVVGVPTSERSEKRASERGIPLTTLELTPQLDLTIDGADEVDPHLDLIKGGGGALLREKIVASSSRRMIVFVDSTKRVECLGRFPLPVEVIPFAAKPVAGILESLGGNPRLRVRESGEAFRTDEGNAILDCHFGRIDDSVGLAARLNAIPGVVEHGLFIGLAGTVLVARGGEVEVLDRPGSTKD